MNITPSDTRLRGEADHCGRPSHNGANLTNVRVRLGLKEQSWLKTHPRTNEDSISDGLHMYGNLRRKHFQCH
jgi:hypothetical protein